MLVPRCWVSGFGFQELLALEIAFYRKFPPASLRATVQILRISQFCLSGVFVLRCFPCMTHVLVFASVGEERFLVDPKEAFCSAIVVCSGDPFPQ